MVVLDTHVLIWAVEDSPNLGPLARARIDHERQNGGVGISAITPWEIALLAVKGRLELTMDVRTWIDQAMAWPGIELCPIDTAIAVDSVQLPGTFHADPADRFLTATARLFSAPLVTSDARILDYSLAGHVRTVNAGR